MASHRFHVLGNLPDVCLVGGGAPVPLSLGPASCPAGSLTTSSEGTREDLPGDNDGLREAKGTCTMPQSKV